MSFAGFFADVHQMRVEMERLSARVEVLAEAANSAASTNAAILELLKKVFEPAEVVGIKIVPGEPTDR